MLAKMRQSCQRTKRTPIVDMEFDEVGSIVPSVKDVKGADVAFNGCDRSSNWSTLNLCTKNLPHVPEDLRATEDSIFGCGGTFSSEGSGDSFLLDYVPRSETLYNILDPEEHLDERFLAKYGDVSCRETGSFSHCSKLEESADDFFSMEQVGDGFDGEQQVDCKDSNLRTDASTKPSMLTMMRKRFFRSSQRVTNKNQVSNDAKSVTPASLADKKKSGSSEADVPDSDIEFECGSEAGSIEYNERSETLYYIPDPEEYANPELLAKYGNIGVNEALQKTISSDSVTASPPSGSDLYKQKLPSVPETSADSNAVRDDSFSDSDSCASDGSETDVHFMMRTETLHYIPDPEEYCDQEFLAKCRNYGAR